MAETVTTQFAECDGLSIAWQLWGDGPRNLVLVPGMISHLEASMEDPGYLHWMKALSSIGRLATFDKRGNGMSDRIRGAPSPEERVADIEAVMDAADMPSATLIGFSEGASIACVYAALRPERVDRLVLCGGYARGRLARGLLTEAALAEALEQLRQNWGKPGKSHPFTAFGPDGPDGQEAWAHFQRMSATPLTIVRLFELAAYIDITALLPSITQPTLVLHRAHEEPNGRPCAEEFVRLMPDAEHQAVPGHQHVPWEGDAEAYAARIIEFVTGAAPRALTATRTLATVLFSDLVGSTQMQARIGDEAWSDLMSRHDDICSAEIARHDGRLIKFTGDGMLATFTSPTGALACAGALQSALAGLDLSMRCGAHTGEIELRDGDISGLGVVAAARITDQAQGGQVLASDLTRQLMLGAPFTFTDRGEHALKGLPGSWRLHAVRPLGPVHTTA